MSDLLITVSALLFFQCTVITSELQAKGETIFSKKTFFQSNKNKNSSFQTDEE